MVLAHLRRGETYRDLAVGFEVGVTTAYRCLREGLKVLAAMAPTLQEAIQTARRKAYVTLDLPHGGPGSSASVQRSADSARPTTTAGPIAGGGGARGCRPG
jgi:hypothetical protein